MGIMQTFFTGEKTDRTWPTNVVNTADKFFKLTSCAGIVLQATGFQEIGKRLAFTNYFRCATRGLIGTQGLMLYLSGQAAEEVKNEKGIDDTAYAITLFNIPYNLLSLTSGIATLGNYLRPSAQLLQAAQWMGKTSTRLGGVALYLAFYKTVTDAPSKNKLAAADLTLNVVCLPLVASWITLSPETPHIGKWLEMAGGSDVGAKIRTAAIGGMAAAASLHLVRQGRYFSKRCS